MSRLPPLKSLQAFRYAAEAKSFKRAAEQLYVTQAAISQQIKTLEQHLGLTLFNRLIREVELTREGQQLLPYVSQAFSALEEGISKVEDDPNPAQLNLCTLPSFASRWLMPRLGLFQEQYPEINLSLSPSLQLIDFTDSHTDIAIRYGKGEYPGLESRLLIEDKLLPVCHPSLLDLTLPISPQLEQLPLIVDDTHEHKNNEPLFHDSLSLNFSNPKLQVTDATMLIEALMSGQGLGVVRFSLVYELLQRGQLIAPLRLHHHSAYNYYLVAPEHHFKKKKVQLFESWLQQEIKDIERAWTKYSTASD